MSEQTQDNENAPTTASDETTKIEPATRGAGQEDGASGGQTPPVPPSNPELSPCPVCGTTKTGNRCEVDGHQEHDT